MIYLQIHWFWLLFDNNIRLNNINYEWLNSFYFVIRLFVNYSKIFSLNDILIKSLRYLFINIFVLINSKLGKVYLFKIRTKYKIFNKLKVIN